MAHPLQAGFLILSGKIVYKCVIEKYCHFGILEWMMFSRVLHFDEGSSPVHINDQYISLHLVLFLPLIYLTYSISVWQLSAFVSAALSTSLLLSVVQYIVLLC